MTGPWLAGLAHEQAVEQSERDQSWDPEMRRWRWCLLFRGNRADRIRIRRVADTAAEHTDAVVAFLWPNRSASTGWRDATSQPRQAGRARVPLRPGCPAGAAAVF